VSLNTAAVKIQNHRTAANAFGSQCIVVAIDAKKDGDDWYVYINAGQKKTDLKVLDWAKQVESLVQAKYCLLQWMPMVLRRGLTLS
jgi:cyclase